MAAAGTWGALHHCEGCVDNCAITDVPLTVRADEIIFWQRFNHRTKLGDVSGALEAAFRRERDQNRIP
jgi:hypothetical protein